MLEIQILIHFQDEVSVTESLKSDLEKVREENKEKDEIIASLKEEQILTEK